MKAVTQDKPGGPDALKIVTDFPKPELKERDVLVKVKAAGLNPIDTIVRKLFGGNFTKAQILGWDGSGIVEELGKEATHFKKGDRVYFFANVARNGTYAEYIAVDERVLALAPTKLSDSEAAALPASLITGWEVFLEKFHLPEKIGAKEKPTQSVLVINGAGGVGSTAIQLAKKVFNLEVVATASRTETVEWVKKLGADHVVDHKKELFPQVKSAGFEHGVDFIFCCADAKHSAQEWPALLKPFGVAAIISGEIEKTGPFRSKSLTLAHEACILKQMIGSRLETQGEFLKKSAPLFDQGILIHTKNKEFPLSEIVEAHKLLDASTAIGKIVLTI